MNAPCEQLLLLLGDASNESLQLRFVVFDGERLINAKGAAEPTRDAESASKLDAALQLRAKDSELALRSVTENIELKAKLYDSALTLAERLAHNDTRFAGSGSHFSELVSLGGNVLPRFDSVARAHTLRVDSWSYA